MGPLKTLSMGALALTLLLPVMGSAQSSSGGQTIFCCENDAGRPVCGDVLPAACFGKAYREISPQGTVRRHVSAPLTKEELERRAEAERLEREEEARRLVQRRLDEALFETYPSLEAIDEAELRALAEIDRGVPEILERERDLIGERAVLRKEAEFYEGRQLPRELENAFASIESEMASYRRVLESKEIEKRAVRERFAADRRRYAELLASGFSVR